MKNPYEVLKLKEQEAERVRKEVEALQIAARLLSGDEKASTGTDGNGRQILEMP
jgi:hypothetical protein